MYLTASEYNTLTGRDASDATDSRIRRASRLLDSRIGNYVRVIDTDSDYAGYKLPLDKLKEYQQEAVKDWVAYMVAALYLNSDSPNTFAQIKLGRFSVSENDADKDNDLPEQVRYADKQLRDSGLINTHVRSNRHVTQNEDYC